MNKPPAKKRGRPRKHPKPETLYRVVWVPKSVTQRAIMWVRNIFEAVWYFPADKYPDLVRTDGPLPTSWLSNTNWTVSWDDEQNPNR